MLLYSLYVRGFGSLIGIHYFELYRITFVKGFKSISQYRRIMHEYITGTIFTCNESITFLIIEPFNFTLQLTLPTFLRNKNL